MDKTHIKKPAQAGFFMCGAPGTIRTCDPLVRSQVLYPAELRVRNQFFVFVMIYRPNYSGISYFS